MDWVEHAIQRQANPLCVTCHQNAHSPQHLTPPH